MLRIDDIEPSDHPSNDDVAPPAASCDSCEDCGNQACVDGACGACTTSLDRGAPLVCVNDACVSLSG